MGTEQTGKSAEEPEGDFQCEDDSKKEYVHIGLDGIHVKDEDSEVHVDWKGIHVIDKAENNTCDDSASEVHIDKNGVFVDGKKYDKHVFTNQVRAEFPFARLL